MPFKVNKSKVEYLVADTSCFIQNASLHDLADNIVTCQEVIDEVTNKRQLRRLVVLPYNLTVKNVDLESIRHVTEFSKKTGDYPALSATDIKILSLTYQLEKEKMGTIEHLRTEPVRAKPTIVSSAKPLEGDTNDSYLPGFYYPKNKNNLSEMESGETSSSSDDSLSSDDENNIINNVGGLELNNESEEGSDALIPIKNNDDCDESESSNDDDNAEWINPSNVTQMEKTTNNQTVFEENRIKVACITTDFAMQNVLKQMNLNLCALDGRVITSLRTYILRCYACFKTTSIMTKKFCPKCGNSTLKRVAVSVNENGEMELHINTKRPLTSRGKRFNLPTIKGGKHPNNPILVEDQPMPHNCPSRLSKTKNNPLNDDYIAGFSPFILRDVNSRSAQLGIRPGSEFKCWMQRNPNESRRRRKK